MRLVFCVAIASLVAACDKDASMVESAEPAEAVPAKPTIDCTKSWRKCLDKAKDEAYTDLAKGHARYREVCDGPVKVTQQGDSTMRGCVEAARGLLKGGGALKRDSATARKLLEKACDAKYADGCADLGGGFQGDDFGKPDDALAAKYLRMACDLGKDFSCNAAGKMEKIVKYGRPDEWPKLCEAGKGPSCLKLAMVHYKAVPKENEKAAVFFDKACTAQESKGCDVLAQMYMKKWLKVKNHEAKALEYFDKACALDCGPCCTDGGILADKLRKYDLAVKQWQRGCDLGGDEARGSCARVGQLYIRGRGTKKDLKKAREVLQKACDGGESSSCKQVADIDKLSKKK